MRIRFHRLVPAIAIDLRWRDFFSAVSVALRRTSSESQDLWPSPDAITFLSVRSGFDRLLDVLSLPTDSEIVLSALTIRDMESIVRLHGLRPVGVDISLDQVLPLRDDLELVVSDKTKAVVVTQLFGSIQDLSEIAAFAKERGILLIEDCAQAFDGNYAGSKHADISMFSFGPIKRHTALCGARFVVRDPKLGDALRHSSTELPATSTQWFLLRLVRYAGLKVICSRPFYGVLDRVFLWLGGDIDRALYRMARGFGRSDLAVRIRRRPGLAAERFLAHRLQNVRELEGQWVVPYQSENPVAYARGARREGVSASVVPASLTVIGDDAALPRAASFLSRLVFLNSRQHLNR